MFADDTSPFSKINDIQSFAKYIWNLLGFTEFLIWNKSLTLLFGYFQQDNYKIEFSARRLGNGL